MNNTEVTKAYANWFNEQDYDLYLVLNYQQANNADLMSYKRFSEQLKRLFYRLECEHWGKKKRERYKKICRIERAVCIEKATYLHANIMIKRYGGKSDEQIIRSINEAWLEIQGRSSEKSNEFLCQTINTQIKNSLAVSLYSCKQMANSNNNYDDVFCIEASFIR